MCAAYLGPATCREASVRNYATGHRTNITRLRARSREATAQKRGAGDSAVLRATDTGSLSQGARLPKCTRLIPSEQIFEDGIIIIVSKIRQLNSLDKIN